MTRRSTLPPSTRTDTGFRWGYSYACLDRIWRCVQQDDMADDEKLLTIKVMVEDMAADCLVPLPMVPQEPVL